MLRVRVATEKAALISETWLNAAVGTSSTTKVPGLAEGGSAEVFLDGFSTRERGHGIAKDAARRWAER